MKDFKQLLILTLLIRTFSAACTPVFEGEAIVEDTSEPTEEVVAEESIITEDKTIELTPTHALDVSSWIVKIGDLECGLQPLSEEYPDWYIVDYMEEI